MPSGGNTVAEQITEAARDLRRKLHSEEIINAYHLGSTLALEQAFDRYIMQVSDAAKDAVDSLPRGGRPYSILAPFILPEPVDHLGQAMIAARKERGLIGDSEAGPLAKAFVEQLAKRGLQIVPSNG